jgi:ATP-binding cassette subfamily F protein uup
MGGRRFSGNSDFRAYEDSTEVAQKRKQSRKEERLETKQPTGNLTFNEQKNIKKIEKKSGFRSSKIALEQLFTDEKDNDISKKKELENINNKIEERRTGLSFLLK